MRIKLQFCGVNVNGSSIQTVLFMHPPTRVAARCCLHIKKANRIAGGEKNAAVTLA
jgi:hypothetical protein